jgi:hypothetical protein
MDRIAALRNVEAALSAFEQGEIDLGTMEERVQGVLRTFATEFEDGELASYRAHGDSAADGLVVVAASPKEARERIHSLVDAAGAGFEVERVE